MKRPGGNSRLGRGVGRKVRRIALAAPAAVGMLVAGVTFGGPACKCGQKSDHRELVIGSIRVVDRTPPGQRVRGAGSDDVRSWIRQRLSAAKSVTLRSTATTEGKAKAYRLRVELGAGMTGEPPRYTVILRARAAVPGQLDGLALESSLVAPIAAASGRGSGSPTPKERRAHLKRTAERAATDIAQQAALAVGDDARLRSALGSKKTHRVMAALEIAAVQRRKKVVGALIRLLKHDEQRVVDRAVGALAAIGDRRAVRPLTRLAKLRDTARLAKVIDAIAAIGGEEAVEYLSFIAGGHPDADIRSLAKEALERMKRRR